QFDKLKKKAIEVGTTTRFSATEAAKAMVKMAQAGMSTNEILGAIRDTALLASATLYDFERTSELVTTILRAWRREASDTKEITDILATSINNTKLTMEGLTVAFNYITGVAPQLNLTLQETTSLLGLMVNRGISASTAGTSLRAVLAALLNPTARFRREVRESGLTMDQVNPKYYSLVTILKNLKSAGWGAAEAYRAFRRRAASGATILIENADILEDMAANMYQVNRAAQMSAINLNTASGQWKQFKDSLVASMSTIKDDVNTGLIAMTRLLRDLTLILTKFVASPITKTFSQIFEGWYYIGLLMTKGKLPSKFKEQISETQLNVKKWSDSMRDAKNDLIELRDKWLDLQDALAGSKIFGGKKGEDLWKRVLKFAKDMKLITDREINSLKSREKIEALINRRYKERKEHIAYEFGRARGLYRREAEFGITLASSEFTKLVHEYRRAIVEITDPKELQEAKRRIRKQIEDLYTLFYPKQQKEIRRRVKGLSPILDEIFGMPTAKTRAPAVLKQLEREIGKGRELKDWFKLSPEERMARLKSTRQLLQTDIKQLQIKEQLIKRETITVLNSIAKTTRDIEKENAQIQRDSANLSLDNQRKTIQKREIDLEIGKKLTDLQAKRLQIEINEPANRKKLLAIDTQIQQLEDERYKKYKEMVGTTKIEELQYDKIGRTKKKTPTSYI
ncbi:MAG: phage tail tape measure protein, partial [Candidatus Heimdallarchaeaceae archaeon]